MFSGFSRPTFKIYQQPLKQALFEQCKGIATFCSTKSTEGAALFCTRAACAELSLGGSIKTSFYIRIWIFQG
jgi:hypothetical protein